MGFDEDRKARVKIGNDILFCGELMARLVEDTNDKADFSKTQAMADIKRLRRELLRVYKELETVWW